MFCPECGQPLEGPHGQIGFAVMWWCPRCKLSIGRVDEPEEEHLTFVLTVERDTENEEEE